MARLLQNPLQRLAPRPPVVGVVFVEIISKAQTIVGPRVSALDAVWDIAEKQGHKGCDTLRKIVAARLDAAFPYQEKAAA